MQDTYFVVTDTTAEMELEPKRQRRGPVFTIPLTRWQRRQKHLREQPSNNRALIGFTPDGQAVVNPVQAELRRLFKGIVSRPAAARLEGMAPTPKRLRKDPSTRKARFNGEFVPARSRFAGQGHGEVTYVPVEQTNRLVTVAGREARRVRLAERDERSAEYRAGLARKVAEDVSREATEASAMDAKVHSAAESLSAATSWSVDASEAAIRLQMAAWAPAQRKHYRKRRHGATRAHGRKVHA